MAKTNTLRRWLIGGVLGTLIALNVGLAACGGLDRYIPVRTDADVRELLNIPDGETVYLNEVPYRLEELEMRTRHLVLKFTDNVNDAMALFVFISSLAQTFGAIGSEAADQAGYPLLGTLLLAGLALATDSPGTKRRMKDAEDKGEETGRNGANGQPTPPTPA